MTLDSSKDGCSSPWTTSRAAICDAGYERSLGPAPIVDALAQAGDGLAAAHAAGITHRDFKPDNVIVGLDGRAQVLDFGLAHVRSDTTDHAAERRPERRPAGTPAYMAPEQHRGDKVDATADQFAFCVTLYEALCGRAPFSTDGDGVRASILAGRIREPPRHTPIARKLRKIVWRGLSSDPADRYPSMKALLVDLRRRQGGRRRIAALAIGAVALGGISALTVAGVAGVAAPPDPCEAGETRISSVWSPTRKAELGQAFVIDARPDATQSFNDVAARLDTYADAWQTMHDDACRATHVRHEQSASMLDLRMECLDSRRRDLDAFVATLLRANAPALDRAPLASTSLPPIRTCRDTDALRERLPMPSGTSDQLQIAELRERIAHAAALTETGQYTLALSIIEPVAKRTTALGWPPLTAEAHHRLGVVQQALGRWEPAERALTTAGLEAEVGRDDRLLATIRIALVLLVGDRDGRPREGHLWARLAQSALRRLGGDLELSAALETNLGFVLDREGKPEDVLAHHERALALLDEAGVQGLRRAPNHGNLATSLSQVGRSEQAMRHAEASLALWTDAVGENHANTAVAVAILAYVLDDAGRHAEAVVQHAKALQITERALGVDNPITADRVEDLAVAHAGSGEMALAVEGFRRVVAVRKRTRGAVHSDVATAEPNLGSILGMTGQPEDALVHHRLALSMRETLFGPEHLEVAGSLDGVANQLESLERAEQSLPYRQRALAIRERVLGHDHAELTHPLSNLAYNFYEVGEAAKAQATAERAVALGHDESVRPDERAFAQSVLARVLAGRGGDANRAKALIAEAHAAIGDTGSPVVRKILAEATASLAKPH
ncbi:MAG: serine/threonine protein kinase [Nannocystaceae bacterium]|nr:serine/threonine protein kinase [Nannocystaceae bacterium]